MNYEETFGWQERGSSYYYYVIKTGKIVGTVSKLMSNEIWIGVVNTGKYTFTLDDESHLGQYISLNFAKDAVMHFWDVQNRTLLEN
jgi:dUTPase